MKFLKAEGEINESSKDLYTIRNAYSEVYAGTRKTSKQKELINEKLREFTNGEFGIDDFVWEIVHSDGSPMEPFELESNLSFETFYQNEVEERRSYTSTGGQYMMLNNGYLATGIMGLYFEDSTDPDVTHEIPALCFYPPNEEVVAVFLMTKENAIKAVTHWNALNPVI